MSRLRRSVTALLPALLIPALVACGGEAQPGYGDDTVEGFDGVEVTGDFGKTPKLEWKGVIAYPDEIETETLIEGDGEEIGEGEQVLGTYYVGNGTTLEKEWVYTSGQGGQPGPISPADGEVFAEALDGAHVGDRIAVVAPSVDLVGEYGNPQFGIGTRDALLIVIDVNRNASPKDVPLSQMPKVVNGANGKPARLDFTGIKKPAVTDDLKRSVVTEGDGATVEAGHTVTARYLGQVWGGKQPFDANFNEGITLPLEQFVPGWGNALQGLKVGTRVMIQIPPALGYGEAGQNGIKGDDTMFFVVEIVSATDAQPQQGQ